MHLSQQTSRWPSRFARITEMRPSLDAFRFLATAIDGWANQQQQDSIEYLREENRVLREQLKGKRIRFTDDQRRRLAEKAKSLGRSVLQNVFQEHGLPGECRLLLAKALTGRQLRKCADLHSLRGLP